MWWFYFFFSIFFQSERGLFPNTEFVYDIELPLDFVPSNNDGEVEEFELMPASRVLNLICDPQFKMTSAPVTIDFLIRKGIITLETGEDFFKFFFSLFSSILIWNWGIMFGFKRKWDGLWVIFCSKDTLCTRKTSSWTCAAGERKRRKRTVEFRSKIRGMREDFLVKYANIPWNDDESP